MRGAKHIHSWYCFHGPGIVSLFFHTQPADSVIQFRDRARGGFLCAPLSDPFISYYVL